MTSHTSKSVDIRMLAIASGLVLIAIRWFWLSRYAVSVPFWDQWDAEGWNLIRPYLQGQLSWTDLLAPHNEHRIVWARAAVLGIFVANDNQWDNLVEVYFNAMFFAAPLIALGWIATRSRPALVSVLLWPAIVAFGVLPIAWENFLVGLQLPFDLMVLAALGALWLATGESSLRQHTGIVLLLVFSLGTLASGVLLAPALVYPVIVRWREAALRTGPAAMLLIAIGACAAVGIAVIPHVAGHEPMRAQGVADFAQAFFRCASWPATLGWYAAVIVWLPWVWLQWRVWFTAKPTRVDVFFGAIGVWALIQCAAIAYTRGHEMSWMSSRYTAITLIQALACTYACLRFIEESRIAAAFRIVRYSLAGAALLTIAGGLGFQTLAGYFGMVGRHSVTRIETGIVRAYLIGADASVLQGQPVLHVPYPDPQRLQMMLDEPALANSLTAVVVDRELSTTDGDNTAVSAAKRKYGKMSAAVQILASHASVVLLLSLVAWLLAWTRVVRDSRRDNAKRSMVMPKTFVATPASDRNSTT